MDKRYKDNTMEDKKDNNKTTKYSPVWRGVGIDELKGNVFIYGNANQTDKYNRTKLAIAEYVGTKYGKEMFLLVKETTDFIEYYVSNNALLIHFI